MREAEAAVDDEAARLLGVLQPVLVASQVGGRRSEDALESVCLKENLVEADLDGL